MKVNVWFIQAMRLNVLGFPNKCGPSLYMKCIVIFITTLSDGCRVTGRLAQDRSGEWFNKSVAVG